MDTFKPYRDFKYLVKDDKLLHGQITLRGTRISASMILECIGSGMSIEEINEEYNAKLTPDILHEICKVASELLEKEKDVAA